MKIRAGEDMLCTGHLNGTCQTSNEGLKTGDTGVLNDKRWRFDGYQKCKVCEFAENGAICGQPVARDSMCRKHCAAWLCEFTTRKCCSIRVNGTQHCAKHEGNVLNPRLWLGELAIVKFLEVSNIQFQQETSFAGCIDVSPLRFDFFLPAHNLIIEFDGKQHFEAVDYWKGAAGLEERQRRDSIKDNWCINNGRLLLRISFLDINEVPEIIAAALNIGLPAPLEHVPALEVAEPIPGRIIATKLYAERPNYMILP